MTTTCQATNRWNQVGVSFCLKRKTFSEFFDIVLPNSIVDVDTVSLFKARLDKVWMQQDVEYDFAADLTGIGDRSTWNTVSGL